MRYDTIRERKGLLRDLIVESTLMGATFVGFFAMLKEKLPLEFVIMMGISFAIWVILVVVDIRDIWRSFFLCHYCGKKFESVAVGPACPECGEKFLKGDLQ